MENEIKVKTYGEEQVAFGLEFKNPPHYKYLDWRESGGMYWR